MRLENLAGKRFSMLTVIDRAESKRVKLICQCDCGNKTTVAASSLKGLHTKSCGCLKGGKIVHGHALNGNVSREFVVWAGILDRCTNENNPAYARYGGRGITVCDRWLNSFPNFFEDMGKRPEGQSIDRIDNGGNYEPSNCRWATAKTQCRNTRRNVVIEYNGIKKCLSEWAEILNINVGTLYRRIVRGKLSPEIAFTTSRLKI